MEESDKPVISHQDLAVALSELHLEGLIEWRGEDQFKLTDKGHDYAWRLWQCHSPKEKIALVCFVSVLCDIAELETGEKIDES